MSEASSARIAWGKHKALHTLKSSRNSKQAVREQEASFDE